MITLPHYSDETAVFGLGRSGLASVDALLLAGCEVVAWDDNPAQCALAEKRGATIRDLNADFGQPARLVVSPGIALTHPAPHPIIVAARQQGTEIIGDMDLFQAGLDMWRAAHQDAKGSVCVIGITGTNGKSTSTALIGHMLQEAGWNAQIGGNIGTPILQLDAPKADAQNAYVLEASSYQLELNRSLNCDIGVLTNVTPDHLDRHGSMAGYVAAKQQLFAEGKCQYLRIIGTDEKEGAAMAAALQGHGVEIKQVSSRDAQADITFSADCLYLAQEKLLSLEYMNGLRGLHNAQNAAVAFCVGDALGLTMMAMSEAFMSFPGLAHRMQPIERFASLTFVNDSKATNAEAARQALSACRNIYWIVGGRAKQGGLDGLAHSLSEVRHAYLIGEAAALFADQLASMAPTVPRQTCDKLDIAVSAAADQALSDNLDEATILLSPAAASFDQFPSFEARGDAFCNSVAAWKHRQEGGM